MKITELRMQEIKRTFTETERSWLQKAVTGESLCPKYLIIDLLRVPHEVQAKLRKIEKGERGTP